MVDAVFDAGAVTCEGETPLLVGVEDRSGVSHFCVARSQDGYANWRIEAEPSFRMDPGLYEESWGIEDPRITQCGSQHMIVHTGYSRDRPLACLAATPQAQVPIKSVHPLQNGDAHT